MNTTQMISDHSQTPNIWPKKPTCGATLEVWGGSAPGMGVASVSFEKMRTSPNKMKFVAKVATNDGTFKNTLIMPLIAPIPMHTTKSGDDCPARGDPERPEPVHDPRREEEDLPRREIDLSQHEYEDLAYRERPVRPGEARSGIEAK